MALFTFSGGVHPADGKEFAKNSPITEYLPKGDVVLPLGQHIGAPAQPIVSKGDQVLVGQKVAEAGGFVSANIFSSVSGTVKAIEPDSSNLNGSFASLNLFTITLGCAICLISSIHSPKRLDIPGVKPSNIGA